MHTSTMPAVLIEQYYAQLEDLNYAISCRVRGQRFPNENEVEIIRKLSICIKNLQSGLPQEIKEKKATTVKKQPVAAIPENEASDTQAEQPLATEEYAAPTNALAAFEVPGYSPYSNKYSGRVYQQEEEHMPPLSLVS